MTYSLLPCPGAGRAGRPQPVRGAGGDGGARRHTDPTGFEHTCQRLWVAAGGEREGTVMATDLTARQPRWGGPAHYGGRRARAHRDEEAWSAMLLDGLAAVYERGWQPLDVAH